MVIENIKFKATIRTAKGTALTKDGASLTVQDTSPTPTYTLYIYRDTDLITPSQTVAINPYFGKPQVSIAVPTSNKLTFKLVSSHTINDPDVAITRTLVGSTSITDTRADKSITFTLGMNFEAKTFLVTIQEKSIGLASLRFNINSLNVVMNENNFRIVRKASGHTLTKYSPFTATQTNARGDWELGPDSFYHGEDYRISVRFPEALPKGTVVNLRNSLNGASGKSVTIVKATDVVVFDNMRTYVTAHTGMTAVSATQPWSGKNAYNASWYLSLNGKVVTLDGASTKVTRAAGRDERKNLPSSGLALYPGLDVPGGGTRYDTTSGGVSSHDDLKNTPFYYIKPNTTAEIIMISGGAGGSASVGASAVTAGYWKRHSVGEGQRGGDGYIIIPVKVGGKFQLQLINILTGGQAAISGMAQGGRLIKGSDHPLFEPAKALMTFDNKLAKQGDSITWSIDDYSGATVTVTLKYYEVGGTGYVYTPNMYSYVPPLTDGNGLLHWGKGGQGNQSRPIGIGGVYIGAGVAGGSGGVVILTIDYKVPAIDLGKGWFNDYPVYNPWFTGDYTSLAEMNQVVDIPDSPISDNGGLAGGLRGSHKAGAIPTHGYSGLWYLNIIKSPKIQVYGPGTHTFTTTAGKRYRVYMSGGGGASAGTLETTDALFNQLSTSNFSAANGTDSVVTGVGEGWSVIARGGGGGTWALKSPNNSKAGVNGLGQFTSATGDMTKLNAIKVYPGVVGYQNIGGKSTIGSQMYRGDGGSLPGSSTTRGAGASGGSADFLIQNPGAGKNLTITITVGVGGQAQLPNSTLFTSAPVAGFPGYEGVVIIEEL